MGMDRKIMGVLLVVCLLILLWFALDHVFFPTLPTPAGVPPISK